MRRWWTGLAAGALALLGAQSAPVNACTIDGKPTLTVNGYAVIINTVVPIRKVDLARWAPFVLPFPLHTGRTETLAEISQGVPLPVEAFKTPWRWNFGDGTKAGHGT